MIGAKQVALDGGRAFVVTESGRLIEGVLTSGAWRWTFIDLPHPPAEPYNAPSDNRQAHGRLG